MISVRDAICLLIAIQQFSMSFFNKFNRLSTLIFTYVDNRTTRRNTCVAQREVITVFRLARCTWRNSLNLIAMLDVCVRCIVRGQKACHAFARAEEERGECEFLV